MAIVFVQLRGEGRQIEYRITMTAIDSVNGFVPIHTVEWEFAEPVTLTTELTEDEMTVVDRAIAAAIYGPN